MTLHAYLYCLNDPIDNVDLTGEITLGGTLKAVGIGMQMYGAFDIGWNIGSAIMGRITWRQLGMNLLIDAAFEVGGAGAVKLGKHLLKMSRVGKVAKKAMKLLPAPKIHRHHIFNQFGKSAKYKKYRDFFLKHGINVNDYSVDLTKSKHVKDIHKAGQNWTTIWKRWIDANPNATTKEVFQQAGKMMDEYGISHLEIIPYRG